MKTIKALLSDNEGSTLIMVGVFMLTIFAIIGAGVDFGRAQLVKMKIQQATDMAALAAANPPIASPTIDDRQAIANMYYNLNFPAVYLGVKRPPLNFESNNVLNVSANSSANLDTNFIRILGQNTVNVSSGSKVDIGIKNPRYDAMLVLDVSDSMDWKFNGDKCDYKGESPCNNNDGNVDTVGKLFCYDRASNYYSCGDSSRLTSLKEAATSLTSILLSPDIPDNTNRIAIVTWNDKFRQQLDFSNDKDGIITFLNNMTARYSTNSTTGLNKAWQLSKAANGFRTDTVHAVVLLTDGENNGGGGSHDQAIDNSSVAVCQQFKNLNPPTIVYTIALGDAVNKNASGGFVKPEGEFIDKFLRNCASGTPDSNENKYYFIAPTSSQLNEIFKTIANNLQKLRITD